MSHGSSGHNINLPTYHGVVSAPRSLGTWIGFKYLLVVGI